MAIRAVLILLIIVLIIVLFLMLIICLLFVFFFMGRYAQNCMKIYFENYKAFGQKSFFSSSFDIFLI